MAHTFLTEVQVSRQANLTQININSQPPNSSHVANFIILFFSFFGC